MGLECKICGREVTALEGVRCRQCRRLVCSSCIKKEKTSDGGAICLECTAPPPSAGTSEEQAKSEKTGNRIFDRLRRRFEGVLHDWHWLVFGLLLTVLFLFVLLRPILRAKVLASRLSSSEERVADEACEALVEARGRAVYTEMETLIIEGNADARRRAVHVIGELGYPEAVPMLQQIADDPRESELMRATAREAIVKINN